MADFDFKFNPKDTKAFTKSEGSSKELVVLLHGYDAQERGASLHFVKACVSASKPYADIWLPDLPIHRFSFESLTEIAQYLTDQIDSIWDHRLQNNDSEPYTHITFIGHSTGGLLARKVYIYACGENKNAPFEDGVSTKQPRKWADKIDRLILLAGMNRGWSVSDLTISSWLTIRLNLGVVLGQIIMFFRALLGFRRQTLLIFQAKKGAPFITQLRIQWLAMAHAFEQKNKAVGGALVIQMLGTIDDMVSPEDNVDLVTGSNFIYLEVPKSGHLNVTHMDNTPEGKQRSAVLGQALAWSESNLKKINNAPVDLVFQKVDKDVTDVIFVIHGIRDKGFWTQKIAGRIKREGEKIRIPGKPNSFRKYAAETSTYGYFAMLPFILRSTRKRKVEWIMDQYAEDLALYPNADFSYVGHSNGTYLLAQALKDYPACHFKNVVFAGSVVPVTYDWGNLLAAGRVQAVLNYVATTDWVVAIFPKFFQTMSFLGIDDLGSAGHDGFTKFPNYQVEYVQGQHSAAIQEDMWDDITYFALHGKKPVPTHANLIKKKRTKWVVQFGEFPPLIWLGILILLTLGGIVLWCVSWNGYKTTLSSAIVLKTLTVLLYLRLLWFIVTRL